MSRLLDDPTATNARGEKLREDVESVKRGLRLAEQLSSDVPITVHARGTLYHAFDALDRLAALSTPEQELGEGRRTEAAANIMDVWMGGDQSWRARMDDSEILESTDWQMALTLADAALRISSGRRAR